MISYNVIVVIVFVFFTVVTICLENLSQIDSIKSTPSQSTSYDNGHHAEKAVDGQLQVGVDESTCSFTIGGQNVTEAWWKLSLREMSNVAYLEIYFRSSTPNRHVGFSVFVFNDSSYIPPSNSSEHQVFKHDTKTCIDRVMNVTINKETQGIALYNSRYKPVNTNCPGYEPSFATIEICEVKVMGCQSKHFGKNCTPCNPKCRNRQCDVFNGSCIAGCSNNVIQSKDCS
ncbi:uncharacterized protein LOC134230723, partial [Saccostrea cucullata]|uniref:uncharacterized protein LOC134230723 n=1 Tax=Saccostrea cuccullata TaxID=36930 RepID=UPI002ED3ABED